MSKGGPWYDPLSGLVVYTWGSPWYHAGRAYHHAVPRVGRRARVGKAALRRRGKFPSLFSTTSLGEAGTNSAARVREILATAPPLWTAWWRLRRGSAGFLPRICKST